MPKTGIIRARVDPQLKTLTEEVLRSLGLSATDTITLFYHQVVLHQGLPFAVRRPGVRLSPETVAKVVTEAVPGEER